MKGLLLFDLDGTLIDSKEDIVTSINFALKDTGHALLPREVILDFVGRGLEQLIGDCIRSEDKLAIEKVVKSFWNYYLKHLLDETHLYPGVQRFLDQKQDYKMAIVTNKPYEFTRLILDGLKIAHHFDWVIGGDSLPVQKPSPEFLAPIFADIPKDFPKDKILMIGDSDIDIETGKAAGVKTCGISQGFRPREELENCKPDYLVEDFEGFLKIGFFHTSP